MVKLSVNHNFFQLSSVRIPVRLYVWNITEDFEDLEDAPQLDSWDKISYINRPVEIVKEDGKSCWLYCFLLAQKIGSSGINFL